MKTVIHSYNFDIRNEAEKLAYEELKLKLKSNGLKCLESHGGGSHYSAAYASGLEIELETQHLFDNQWNTKPIEGLSASGLRVFDWAQDYKPNGNAWRKRGHWLEQTEEMRSIRANTCACGYCGKQEPISKGLKFCDACIGSEYLEPKELYLLRMLPISAKHERAELTEAEKAYLLPIYKDAQLHGHTPRDKARITEKRAELEEDYKKAIKTAETEYKGFTWLLDHGIKTDNVIYYSHMNKFSFGWRKPIPAEIKSELLNTLKQFPYPFELK